MLQSNGKIKKLSTFLIAGFFLSFLAGEVNAIRSTYDSDRHDEGASRVCRQRQPHHHNRHGHHQRRDSYLHQRNHHHRHSHGYHHRRHIEKPSTVAPAKRVSVPVKVPPRKATPQESRVIRGKAKTKPVVKTVSQRGKSVRESWRSKRKSVAPQWRKSLGGRRVSKRIAPARVAARRK
jgi:hypothetical protein